MPVQENENIVSVVIASLVRRRRVLAGAAVLVALGWLGSTAWRMVQDPLRRDPQFQIAAESIQITTPPPWVRADIRAQAVERAKLQGPLSVIDPQLTIGRLTEAFRLEPWVRKVNRVELNAPNNATVELEWRRPLAAVELQTPAGLQLFPIDPERVRLPSQGLGEAQLRRLPRITDITGAPPEGEAWVDPQVSGAVALIMSLGDNWNRLALADVTPSRLPEIRGDRQFYQFELLAIGGTRIYWGAAPGVVADEPAFESKLATLLQFVSREGVRLDTSHSPKAIDLRNGLDPKPRIAKKNGEKRTAQADSADGEVVK